jgi:hypothetical protein
MAERDTGRRPGLTTDERQRLKQLERQNFELKRARRDPEESLRIFRTGGARPPGEVMVAFIDDHRKTLGSSRSAGCCRSPRRTYFRRKAEQRDPTKRSARALRDEVLRAIIHRIWDENHARA